MIVVCLNMLEVRVQRPERLKAQLASHSSFSSAEARWNDRAKSAQVGPGGNGRVA